MTTKRWRAAVATRFPDREVLSHAALYERCWAAAGLPQAEIAAFLQLFEEEFGIPAGLLRPEDSLAALWTPVASRNPFRAMYYRFWADEHWGELNYRLGQRLHRRGQSSFAAGVVTTVDDFVWAWCGRLGPQAERLASAT
jgi:hypothetical protein